MYVQLALVCLGAHTPSQTAGPFHHGIQRLALPSLCRLRLTRSSSRCHGHARDFDYSARQARKDGDQSLSSLVSIDTEGPWIAFAGPAGADCAELTELFMEVHFKSHPGEHLHLTGNHPILGCWDLNKAFPLKWTQNHKWQMESAICVEPGTTLEYKYVLFREGEEEPVWQGGKNMVVHIPEDSEGCRFIVEDSWDSCRHDQHINNNKVDEHMLPQPIPQECFQCAQCLMPHLHWRTCPKYAAMHAATAAAAGAGSALPPGRQLQA